MYNQIVTGYSNAGSTQQRIASRSTCDTVARVALIFSALVLGQSSPLRPATRSSASPSLGTYDPRETVRAEVARGY